MGKYLYNSAAKDSRCITGVRELVLFIEKKKKKIRLINWASGVIFIHSGCLVQRFVHP